MLHAEQLIYQQPDKQLVTIQHQHPALLARRTDGSTEEMAEINDRQEPATHVGYAPDPGLDPGQSCITGLMENFADFPKRSDHGLSSQAEADTTPGFGHH